MYIGSLSRVLEKSYNSTPLSFSETFDHGIHIFSTWLQENNCVLFAVLWCSVIERVSLTRLFKLPASPVSRRSVSLQGWLLFYINLEVGKCSEELRKPARLCFLSLSLFIAHTYVFSCFLSCMLSREHAWMQVQEVPVSVPYADGQRLFLQGLYRPRNLLPL